MKPAWGKMAGLETENAALRIEMMGMRAATDALRGRNKALHTAVSVAERTMHKRICDHCCLTCSDDCATHVALGMMNAALREG